MADKILNLDTVNQCNQFMGCKTAHPLVSVLDLATEAMLHYSYIKFDFYAVLFVEHSCCDLYYGKQLCDYSDGTLIFLTPKECLDLDMAEFDSCLNRGKLLVFHRELLPDTPLFMHFEEDYSFFRYQDNEALHISAREKQIVMDGLQNIKKEVVHDIDRFSQLLITRNIELFLDHCKRFYERQFILRHDGNEEKIRIFNSLIDNYINNGELRSIGFPKDQYWANEIHSSPDYLNDMLQHETGKNVQEYVQFYRLEKAKKWVLQGTKTIDEIACNLGYPTATCFSRAFKKIFGGLPGEYRAKMN